MALMHEPPKNRSERVQKRRKIPKKLAHFSEEVNVSSDLEIKADEDLKIGRISGPQSSNGPLYNSILMRLLPDTSTTETYIILGIEVKFPFKAYACQLSMMQKIIKALNSDGQENALLESPTGSGKTLSLLCSVLAWLRHRKQQLAGEILEKSDKSEESNKSLENLRQSCDQKESKGKSLYLGIDDNLKPNLNLSESLAQDTNNTTGGVKKSSSSEDVITSSIDDARDFQDLSFMKAHFSKAEIGTSMLQISYANDDLEKGKHKTPSKGTAIGKVFVTSRTHKQLAQMIKEMRTTPYRPKTSILAGRNHLCLQDRVLKSGDPNEECNKLLESNSCRYFIRAENLSRSLKNNEDVIYDVEDLVEAGKEHGACPYYASRNLALDAEVLFAPYNYIIDSGIRDAMNINLNNSLVILDEAHNIEDTARSCGSFSIDTEKLDVMTVELESLRLNFGKQSNIGLASELIGHYETLKAMIYAFNNWIKSDKEGVTPIMNSTAGESSKVWIFSKDLILQTLEENNLGKVRTDLYSAALSKLVSLESTFSSSEREQDKSMRSLSQGSHQALAHLIRCLQYLVQGGLTKDLRIAHTTRLQYATQSQSSKSSSSQSRQTHKMVHSISFWCMNPALTFSDLSSSCKSIILASGTLSPMDSFSSELDTSFGIRMEGRKHVIHPSRLFAGILPAMISGRSSLVTFKTVDQYIFQDDLGSLLLQICRAVVSGGILVFLPSYSLLKKLMVRWQSTNLYSQLEATGSVFTEPHQSSIETFNEILTSYLEAIMKPNISSTSHSLKHQSLKKNVNTKRSLAKAIMFAVYRGKLSEGIDFADEACRCVVAVGIPFPNAKDVQIQCKKEYNDDRVSNASSIAAFPSSDLKKPGKSNVDTISGGIPNLENAASGSHPPSAFLSGQKWLSIQAYRALNQSLGRCIRHREDWGAIILIDSRWIENSHKSYLSPWIQSHLKTFQDPLLGIQQLEAFCKNLEINHEDAVLDIISIEDPDISSNIPRLEDECNNGKYRENVDFENSPLEQNSLNNNESSFASVSKSTKKITAPSKSNSKTLGPAKRSKPTSISRSISFQDDTASFKTKPDHSLKPIESENLVILSPFCASFLSKPHVVTCKRCESVLFSVHFHSIPSRNLDDRSAESLFTGLLSLNVSELPALARVFLKNNMNDFIADSEKDKVKNELHATERELILLPNKPPLHLISPRQASIFLEFLSFSPLPHDALSRFGKYHANEYALFICKSCDLLQSSYGKPSHFVNVRQDAQSKVPVSADVSKNGKNSVRKSSSVSISSKKKNLLQENGKTQSNQSSSIASDLPSVTDNEAKQSQLSFLPIIGCKIWPSLFEIYLSSNSTNSAFSNPFDYDSTKQFKMTDLFYPLSSKITSLHPAVTALYDWQSPITGLFKSHIIFK